MTSPAGPTRRTTRELRESPLVAGAEFAATLLVRRNAARTTRTEQTFHVVEAGDREGHLTFNVFGDHPLFEPVRNLREGDVIEVTARADFYQGRLSPRLLTLGVLPAEHAAGSPILSTLVETAPEDAGALWDELLAAVATLRPEALSATVRALLTDPRIESSFRTVPAASAMHHAYRHGLLEHTVHLVRAAQALLPLYPEVPRDLALAGVMVHDAGKALEFQPGPVARRTRTGQLQGHVVLGYRLVRQHGLRQGLDAVLLERLEHIVLSHQGELEWGAAVMAATPEAVFVSLVDNLDAKMGMVQRVWRQRGAADEFSDYLPGLKAPVLLEAVESEAAEPGASADGDGSGPPAGGPG